MLSIEIILLIHPYYIPSMKVVKARSQTDQGPRGMKSYSGHRCIHASHNLLIQLSVYSLGQQAQGCPQVQWTGPVVVILACQHDYIWNG